MVLLLSSLLFASCPVTALAGCGDRLMTLANYAMKLEREVWGVLEGPWGSDTWMGWRRDWAQKVLLFFMSVFTKPRICAMLSPFLS